jgi:protein-tyrosine phosphatase
MPTTNEPANVLFICTGNYYRSRFAEAWFNHRASQAGLGWRAFSRGFHIDWNPDDISHHTVKALRKRGVHDRHVGSPKQTLTRPDLEKAAMIIALKEAEHRPLMRERFPDWEDRITYWSVHDLDVTGPEEALPVIEQQVNQLLAALSAAS